MHSVSLNNQIKMLFQLLAILLVGFAFIFMNFVVRIDWLESNGALDKFIYLNRFVVDCLQLCAFVVLLYGRQFWLRFLAYVIIIIFVLAYFIQAQAYSTIGSFLPEIALENIDHVDFLDTRLHYYIGSVWLFFFIVFSYLYFNLPSSLHAFMPFLRRLVIAVVILLLAVALKNDRVYLTTETVNERFSFYNSGRPGIAHASPISKLKETLSEYFNYLKRQALWGEQAAELSVASKVLVDRDYPYFAQYSKDYPMIRDYIYQGDLPFDLKKNKDSEKLNIIVFYAEGISARVIQPYSQNFPNISPNIEQFSKQAIQVNNFYNHTYATYRGLGGELCSLYPIGRLIEETNYYCLPHLLRDEGYSTRFIFSQSSESSDLDDVAYRAGFEDVDSVETLYELVDGDAFSRYESKHRRINDDKLIDGLIHRLKEESINDGAPYFIGLYNFETHTGVRLNSDDVHYTQQGANSYVLDTFHNFDKVFGKFWNYFINSEHYENTIVVLTSDHATFPGKDYRALLQQDKEFAPIFADQIPLLIYHPKLKSNIVVDKGKHSSIDLAPTLAHILGIENRKVPFFGRSIFDADSPERKVMAGSGRVLYTQVNNNRWVRLQEDTPKKKILTEALANQEVILLLQRLESENRLWPEAL